MPPCVSTAYASNEANQNFGVRSFTPVKVDLHIFSKRWLHSLFSALDGIHFYYNVICRRILLNRPIYCETLHDVLLLDCVKRVISILICCIVMWLAGKIALNFLRQMSHISSQYTFQQQTLCATLHTSLLQYFTVFGNKNILMLRSCYEVRVAAWESSFGNCQP
jgi:hypothetical protein